MSSVTYNYKDQNRKTDHHARAI